MLQLSLAFYPQTNSQTKQINAKLEKYLRLYVDQVQDDQVDWLPLVEFIGNNTVLETIGVLPFFANYGFYPRMGVELAKLCLLNLLEVQKREFFQASEIAAQFEAILGLVTALARQAQDCYKGNANCWRQDVLVYWVGDKVMLSMENYKTRRLVQKLDLQQEGLFEVTKASSYAVTLQLLANIKIFNTFYVSRVRRCRSNDSIPGQGEAQSDVRANRGRVVTRTDKGKETQEWKFESILDYGKANNGQQQYLVKWEGFNDPTQQLATDLRSCNNDIQDFYNANPDKPRPLSQVKRRRQRDEG